MKTTRDTLEAEPQDPMRRPGATSTREAVVTALHERNRRHRMAKLVRFSGTCDVDANSAIEKGRDAKERRR